MIHGSIIITVFYFYEILVTRSSKEEISSLKGAMNHAFSMTDLGLLSQFWGLEISQSNIGIKVHQSKYVSYLLNKLKMKYFKPSKTPFLSGVKLEEAQSTPLVNNTLYRQLVGCLIYLTHTRTSIYYVVGVAPIHMDQPHEIHCREAKIILNFVQGTRTHAIHYLCMFSSNFCEFN